ncbi:uncharacterized protein LOC131862501 [Cryptomeria japonica]|uniref:uncharacterized protein LOC131862501 n=1 Tax=Cryptomeria japonica TaxID=3369 RepID=UPI0027DA1186|nr:uncharacterized protein LOC131862501 [Cryptomeria japonica]
MYFFVKKLQYVKDHLKRWNLSCFGHLKSRKRSALEHLAVITHQIWDNGFSDALGKAKSQAVHNVEEWELHKEIFWKQKAQVDWLQEGDSNCAFFHQFVQDRHNKGYISSLVTSEGLQISSMPAMSHKARHYYSDLFTKDPPPTMDEEHLILFSIPSLVTNSMNASLIHPISFPELEDVVFGMNKVIVNSEPSEPFGVSCGLCQGDPLSPYLFIIMAESMGYFLKFHGSQGLIHGWQWGNGLPQISHIQFVDDIALMGFARIREAKSFWHALDIYLAASG